MKKQTGFTLAEVLITLGIIGVVAAMTIPTLMTNTNSAKFKAQYKKTLSTLNQAGLMGEANYDLNYSTITGKNASGTAECTASSNPSKGDASICALFNGTLTGTSIVTSSTYSRLNQGLITVTAGADIAYVLADGSYVAVSKNMSGCTKAIGNNNTISGVSCIGWIDVNGAALPNKEVTCDNVEPIYNEGSGNAPDCKVSNAEINDIFPIAFYDGTVAPATNAARSVLTSAK